MPPNNVCGMSADQVPTILAGLCNQKTRWQHSHETLGRRGDDLIPPAFAAAGYYRAHRCWPYYLQHPHTHIWPLSLCPVAGKLVVPTQRLGNFSRLSTSHGPPCLPPCMSLARHMCRVLTYTMYCRWSLCSQPPQDRTAHFVPPARCAAGFDTVVTLRCSHHTPLRRGCLPTRGPWTRSFNAMFHAFSQLPSRDSPPPPAFRQLH